MNTSETAFSSHGKNLKIFQPDAIIRMFDHTDDNGILYIPEWNHDDNYNENAHFYRCVMNWNSADRDDVLHHYESLCDDLKQIAENWDAIYVNSAEEVLPERLFAVWNKYICDFETDDINTEQISDISDRFETVSMIASIRKKMSVHAELSKEEESFYDDYKDVFVSKDETELYDEYKNMLRAESEKRVGRGLAAYDVMARARRLCRLISLKAPLVIIENESRLLAEAMAVHTYCENMETVVFPISETIE